MAATLLLSAFLLFCVQLMIGKMMLPLLGGTAAVWTTAVLFFQAALFAGYVYADWIGRLGTVRTQAVAHLLVLAAVVAFLPIRFGSGAGSDAYQNPVVWELWHLVRTTGIPLFAISSTAPLLQAWYARAADDAAAADPYFLYAASNTGSLLALLLYPFLIEPRLGVRAQSVWWSAGYGALLVLVVVVAAAVWKAPARRWPADDRAAPPPALNDRAYWLAAAFVPSALMLGVTSHISLNLVPMPLLWVLPLAVYLLTFILAFGRRVRVSFADISRIAPAILIPLCPVLGLQASKLGADIVLITAHLILLFIGALLCHTALAERRPQPRYLTEYYVFIALGGALGGVAATVIAPMLFTSILEYPLLLAAAVFFRRPAKGSGWTSATALAALIVGFAVLLPRYTSERGATVYVARNFFGVKEVVDEEGGVRKLYHGNTLHGVETMETGEPLAYYRRSGPLGDIMTMMGRRPNQHVGVVGLGAGSIAAYGGPTRHVTFFEIDPAVQEIAAGSFTFLRRCGRHCDVIIGDGRLSIERFPEREFDLLVLDAFSSDSIPPHLLSREAMEIYLSRLKPDGAILFHVSNRYLNVRDLVAALAVDTKVPAFVRSDVSDLPPIRISAQYVLAGATHEAIGARGDLHIGPEWRAAVRPAGVKIWTDDYSNLITLMRFSTPH